MCMQSFKSIDNNLAKLRRGVDTTPPPSAPEREGMEKYHLRERVNICLAGQNLDMAELNFFGRPFDRRLASRYFELCVIFSKDQALLIDFFF